VNLIVAEKRELFQMTRIPPEAPTEGKYSKESRVGGQILLMKFACITSFFVSYKHATSQLLSDSLFFTAFHFHFEFIPLTFLLKLSTLCYRVYSFERIVTLWL